MQFKLTATGVEGDHREIWISYEEEVVGIIECDRAGDIVCENRLDRKYLTRENLAFLMRYLTVLTKCANNFEDTWSKETKK